MNIVLSFLAGLVAGGVLATLYHVQLQNVENKAKADYAALIGLLHKAPQVQPSPTPPTSPAP